MYIRVALQVFDGPETDDLPHDTGEEMREVTTQRILDFEVVNGSGWRIEKDSPYWSKWREEILDAVEHRAMMGRIENYILPLSTEVFIWNARKKELSLTYRIRCTKCDDGMSEHTDSGLCSVCDG